MKHEGEVVVVTGASAGVGRAVVREFARQGAHVGLLARGRDRLQATQREVEEAGGRALILPTDVSQPDQVEEAAQTVEEQLGPIDVWVNNAMTTVFSPFRQITPEEFRRVTEVTYLGMVYGTMSALKRMLPRDRGTIVQVGSALSYRSIPLQSAYCGAKHAIRGFTDSIRSELIHDGSRVHITMVQLPGLNTPQFNWCKTRLPRHPQPVPPIFQPELAAEAIVWAAGQRQREVYVGGPTVQTIWGAKLVPGLLDHYLARKAYDGQQAEQPVDPDRPSNLYDAPPGDPGARGIFNDRASAESWQFELSKNAQPLTVAAGAAGLLLGLLAVRAGS